MQYQEERVQVVSSYRGVAKEREKELRMWSIDSKIAQELLWGWRAKTSLAVWLPYKD